VKNEDRYRVVITQVQGAPNWTLYSDTKLMADNHAARIVKALNDKASTAFVRVSKDRSLYVKRENVFDVSTREPESWKRG
jgi:hypothetical protein